MPATLDDDALLAGFTAGRLRAFSHDDHVRVAWLLCTRADADGLDAMVAGIRALAAAAGLERKFHATRTVAWYALVAAAATRTPAADSTEFLAQHPDLRDRAALDRYYSPERLRSTAARTAFVAPDLAPLPTV